MRQAERGKKAYGNPSACRERKLARDGGRLGMHVRASGNKIRAAPREAFTSLTFSLKLKPTSIRNIRNHSSYSTHLVYHRRYQIGSDIHTDT